MPPVTDRYPLPVLQDSPRAGSAERPRAWRSLEELQGSLELERAAHREFPPGAAEPPRGLDRRRFLQLAGTTAALAGLAACKKPAEKVMPYTHQPADVKPGLPNTYATAWEPEGYAAGLVVTSWEGRPTKVEGNPDHPASLGATNHVAQALLVDLYDTSRVRGVKLRGTSRSFKEYLQEQTERARRLETNGGEGLWLLLEPSASPTRRELLERIRQRFPRARVETYHALSRDNVHEGARLAYGRPLETRVRYDLARVVLSLDADFLTQGPFSLSEAREFSRSRTPLRGEMSRLYVAESHCSVTGMNADHRFRMKPSEVERFALAVLGELSTTHHLAGLEHYGELKLGWPERASEVRAVAADLARNGARAVVVVGERQPPRVHAVAHLLNETLGSQRRLITLHEPGVEAGRSGPEVLRELAEAASAGRVDTLVVTAFDPAYTAPVGVTLGAALMAVPNTVYLAFREDETSKHSAWVLPAAHVLESWGDTRAVDGTASIIQPLIEPLFHGLTELDVLSPFAGVAEQTPYQLVKAHWQRREGAAGAAFNDTWDQWLAVGTIPGTQSSGVTPTLDTKALDTSLQAFAPKSAQGLELNLLPGYKVRDGRYFHNAWLQEMPDPLTMLSWSNAALLSPRTAERLSLKARDKVKLTLRGRELEAPVYVLPGHADDTVSLELGWGREWDESPEPPVELGVNAYLLRHADAPWFAEGLQVEKVEGRGSYATSQDHWAMEGREIALQDTLEDFEKKKPEYLKHLKGPEAALYEPFKYDKPNQWAMAVDLNRCIGCGACVVACQAENNIPVVGREQVERGREMYWLRVDRYFEGSPDEPRMIPQPMMCQHCEAAPCEYVCPVNATVHSDEGLNEMVYNRCIGTRYCSNNCPYKVRRFNYLDYRGTVTELEKLGFNPDVTVRMRGVMEKCTYCVQRIERARIEARKERRPIDTEALESACEQVCPTEAITFGSLHERDSEVAQRHGDPRHYAVLHELGTKPRTAYLARIKNPNPELEHG
ncbi:TAT-variant-translocated molybdopterin oxidoreductase [Archangium lansingense]|uniref:TAT-variant-translocated molybdopterin oxidoreductase n=1 Tax=Archangium lansingense TaxID=2995310 RepID=A0ABT4AP44_9BACT|nr:TAT-variant-translocated molybdopterin oxidoreductase [Archangium lansinium]MCY1083472.1 TAT-variant-translocated molybdopterin oxidoreductase [Archangium lansinium]